MSSPLDVNGVMAWLNATFGWSIPVLPFPSPWMAPLTELWSLIVPGSLPEPGDPFPWTIAVSGTWSPNGGLVVLQNITIVVAEEGSPPMGFLARVKRAVTRTRKRKRTTKAR